MSTADGDPDYVGRFRVESAIGHGGQGAVYRGCAADGTEVAIKLLHEDLIDDAEVVARFRREGTLAREVDHPNVVRVLACGLHGERPYVVTEFVPGLTLSEMLERFGRFDERAGLRLAGDLLRGLGAIHDAGLIHRDLKPGNVIVDGERRARIVDLGLSRSAERSGTALTGEGRVIGTPNYMAPEQIEDGLDIDRRVDLYALGITLYRCFSGRLPYAGESSVQIMRMHLRGRPPDLSTLCPELSPRTVAIVKRLMAKERRSRYPDARAARDAVEQRLAAFPQPTTATFCATLPEELTAELAARPAAGASAETAWLGTIPDADGTIPPTLFDVDGDPVAATLGDHAPVPAGTPTATLRPPAAAPSRLRLSCPDPAGGTRELFCYGGDRLLVGREGIDRGSVDLCARLLPSCEHAAANRRISGHHCRLHLVDGGARVDDLGGSGGTWVNGRELRSASAALRPGTNELSLAQVLELRVELGRGRSGPFCLVRRRGNAEHHAYLLLPTRIALDLADGRIVAGRGPVELACHDAGLWYRDANRPMSWTPLLPGTELRGGGLVLAVHELRPEDQK